MEFLIISGLSGAGKSRTADILEDLDFYCVDNLPVGMLARFAEFCLGVAGRYERVALVTDIRDRDGLRELPDALEKLSEQGCAYRILFVEAALPAIVKRYKESRRPHPLQGEAGSVEKAVQLEQRFLSGLRDKADFVVDTTSLTLGMLQNELYRLLVGDTAKRELPVKVLSFGFKYGIPLEADMVFDVRFLPNPFYVSRLQKKTGLDSDVRNYVFGYSEAREFLSLLCGMTDFLMPHYVEEGKHSLTIAIGCTGGRHRSVAIAKALCEHLLAQGHSAEDVHRDMEK